MLTPEQIRYRRRELAIQLRFLRQAQLAQAIRRELDAEPDATLRRLEQEQWLLKQLVAETREGEE